MKIDMRIHIKCALTGQIASYSLTQTDEVCDPHPLVVHVDHNLYLDKLCLDFNEKFIFKNGELIALPPRLNKYQVMDYANRVWVEHPENMWIEIRYKRTQLMAACDWTDTLSAKTRLGDAAYEAWQTYRQSLRDITLQADPFNIVWPVGP